MAAEFDKAMLEALRLTRPSFIEGIKMKDGVLADVVRVLCDWRYVKLTRPVSGKSDAFARRWRSITKRGRGTSQYAAVAGFAPLLAAEVEAVIGRIAQSYPEMPKEAPGHVTFVMPLVKGIIETEPLARELPTYVIGSVTSILFHPDVLQHSWKKCIWPIGKEMWPAFAREFEHWTGPNRAKTGAPLSNRKRVVDEKTDFSPSRFEEEIKRAFEGLVLHRRAAAGD